MTALIVLFIAAMWAGTQNALAGGGSFITLPSLMLTGMDARAANITSTVALFPAQLVTGFTGRADAQEPARPDHADPVLISLVGGGIGAVILLATPPSVFARLVPWLVLFATALFAWGSFFRRSVDEVEGRLPPWGMALIQFLIAVYGGYFGGGIGFLMMAALTMTGIAVRNAGALKNILAGMANASAVAIFVFSKRCALAAGARHRGRRLVRRLGRRADAQACQREAPETRRRRHRRGADDRAVLEGGLAVKRTQAQSEQT